MKIRPIYLAGRGYEVNNGKLVSFWLDPWLDKDPICVMYPILFDLAVNQKCLVYDVAMAEWVIQFKIRLPPIVREQWYRLGTRLNNVVLSDTKDKVVWRWAPSRKFTVRSIYRHLTKNDNGLSYKAIWKAKIPVKIKIFMWMIAQSSILTKDNMLARNWQGDPSCYFCGELEIVNHLLFQCPIARLVWGILAICFGQNERPNSYESFWAWVAKALPGGEDVYMFGLAAVC
jgi:hypothetical protein